MAARLIIDGNAVYEIDENCQEYQRKRSKCQGRGRCRECGGGLRKEETDRKKEAAVYNSQAAGGASGAGAQRAAGACPQINNSQETGVRRRQDAKFHNGSDW